jgi:cobalamin synthase
MAFQKLVNGFRIRPRKLFLTDGAGALLTAAMNILLILFEEYIGMPVGMLYYLLAAAVTFAFFSFACYYTNPANPSLSLKIIAIANTFYCLTTLLLVLVFYKRLSIIGLIYFSVEIVVIALLIWVEWATANAIRNSNTGGVSNL